MLEISKITNSISVIIDELLQKGRINDEFKTSFYSSYNQPTLQIGVVGKMKTGKSALINSIIFGADILPSSSEPLTVTLTKISYGEKNTSTIEFLSQQDIDLIKETASYSGENTNLVLQQQAAAEILENLPTNYNDYLGKTLNDIPNEELDKYVTANGEYSGIVKSVMMEINNYDLKGITIIDTPGFNDPVVSRGETTKKFLTDCHVVLFVHNSNGYDETDATLLNTQIEYAGISKLVDVFNKMDTCKSLSLDDWKQELEYFLENRDEYVSEDKHPTAYSLIKNSDAVAVSAFMALCGQRPKESWSDFAKRQVGLFEERYPELTQDESMSLENALIKYSNVNSIVGILNDIASHSKLYLIEKPLKTLIGKLSSIIELIQSEIDAAKSNLDLLKQDRKSALSDLNGLTDFMQSVKETVLIDPMSIRLLDKISESKKRLYQKREDEQKTITKQNFKQPEFLDTGVTKVNIAKYNTFLSRFQSILRNEVESLSSQYGLEAVANEYIRNIILSLVNPKISNLRCKNFEINAKNAIKSEIQQINIAIPPYSITKLPNGNTEQWSLLYTDFGKHYDDNAINELLQKFIEVSQGIGDPSFIIHMISRMEEDLSKELAQTPSDLKTKIEQAEKELAHLNGELQWTKDKLQLLNNIK